MTIQMDVNVDEAGLSEDEAVEALFKSMSGDAGDKSAIQEEDEEQEEDETSEESSEDEEDEEDDAEDDEEDEDGDDEEASSITDKKSKGNIASDDQIVKVSVDGQELEVPVKDLKRLYGQEASLTRKSQELAELRKQADLVGAQAYAVLTAQLEEARDEWEEYEAIDWAIASRKMDDTSFETLRADAKRARARFQDLLEKAQEVEKSQKQFRAELTEEQKQNSIKELQQTIPEWNDELYKSVREHAINVLGFDKQDINSVLDARVIIALHKARMYDLAQQTKPLKTKKINKSPKSVLKPGSNGLGKEAASIDSAKAFKRFKATGSEDDAVAALSSMYASRKR